MLIKVQIYKSKSIAQTMYPTSSSHQLGSPLYVEEIEKVSCVLFQFQPVGAGILTREDAHPACATATVFGGKVKVLLHHFIYVYLDGLEINVDINQCKHKFLYHQGKHQ